MATILFEFSARFFSLSFTNSWRRLPHGASASGIWHSIRQYYLSFRLRWLVICFLSFRVDYHFLHHNICSDIAKAGWKYLLAVCLKGHGHDGWDDRHHNGDELWTLGYHFICIIWGAIIRQAESTSHISFWAYPGRFLASLLDQTPFLLHTWASLQNCWLYHVLSHYWLLQVDDYIWHAHYFTYFTMVYIYTLYKILLLNVMLDEEFLFHFKFHKDFY